jgi:hypothetical protein
MTVWPALSAGAAPAPVVEGPAAVLAEAFHIAVEILTATRQDVLSTDGFHLPTEHGDQRRVIHPGTVCACIAGRQRTFGGLDRSRPVCGSDFLEYRSIRAAQLSGWRS